MSRLPDQGAVHFHGMTLNTACTVVHAPMTEFQRLMAANAGKIAGEQVRDGYATAQEVSEFADMWDDKSWQLGEVFMVAYRNALDI